MATANAPASPSLLAQRVRSASPIYAECNAAPNNISCCFYIAPLLLAQQRWCGLPYYIHSKLPINWTVLTRNGNKVKSRWNPNKITKECPAPRSESPTLLLTQLLTHLSFYWTWSLKSGFTKNFLLKNTNNEYKKCIKIDGKFSSASEIG